MKKICKKPKPWEVRKYTYQEWAKMKHDWSNEAKLRSVSSYFFRFDNFNKGQSNEFIIKSVFGKKSQEEIKKEIQDWYNRCVGAYSEIELR